MPPLASKSFSSICLSVLFAGMLTLTPFDQLQAHDSVSLLTQDAYIGPEIYNCKRTRENGVTQHGIMYGGKLGYDRFRRNAFYVGLWGSYARGTLRGKSAKSREDGEKKVLKSRFREAEAEGRLGFTLQARKGMQFFFIPFVGAGYFNELNHVIPPTPESLLMKSRVSFGYGSLGFISGIFATPRLKIAIDFDAKFMVHGRCKSFDTTQLPEGKKSATTMVGEEIQYYTQLPITYQVSEKRRWLNLSFVPFFRRRHYGEHITYFGRFSGTHFKDYGASLFLLGRF